MIWLSSTYNGLKENVKKLSGLPVSIMPKGDLFWNPIQHI
jgi:hypothetical protein